MRPLLRAFRSCSVVSTVLLWQALAQQPLRDVPSVTATSELILVPVVVHKGGSHVEGLKRSDFSIKVDGTPFPIASLDEVGSSGRVNSALPEIPDAFTNVPVGQQRSQCPIVFVLDTIHTDGQAQRLARDAVIKVLDDLAGKNVPTAMVAIHFDGVQVVYDLTTDARVLKDALQRVKEGKVPKGGPVLKLGQTGPIRDASEVSQNFSGAFDTWHDLPNDQAIRQSLAGLQAVARALAGIPGRKSVVWMNSGFEYFRMFSSPVSERGEETERRSLTMGLSYTRQQDFLETLRAFNAANAAVYPIQVTGDQRHPGVLGADLGSSFDPRFDASRYDTRSTLAAYRNIVSTLMATANATGGDATYGSADIIGALRRAVVDSSAYYVIALKPEGLERSKWHKVKVDVPRKGVELRARAGFYLGAAGARAPNPVESALSSPLESTAIPLLVRWGNKTLADGYVKVLFEVVASGKALRVDSVNGNQFDLKVVAIVRSAAGKHVGSRTLSFNGKLNDKQMESFVRSGAVLHESLSLGPGAYTVRFAVLDNISGRVGTVSAPLYIE